MQEYWRKPEPQLRHDQQVLKTQDMEFRSDLLVGGRAGEAFRRLVLKDTSTVHSPSHQSRMPILLSPSTEAQDRTAEAFHVDEHGELWFRTGDIGAVDEDDFVSLGS